jgi:hypothetical protein
MKNVTKFTLRNSFHNTEVNVLVKRQDSGSYALSESQIKRVKRTLCGCSDCTCNWTRGPQQWDPEYDFDNVGWTFYPKN